MGHCQVQRNRQEWTLSFPISSCGVSAAVNGYIGNVPWVRGHGEVTVDFLYHQLHWWAELLGRSSSALVTGGRLWWQHSRSHETQLESSSVPQRQAKMLSGVSK